MLTLNRNTRTGDATILSALNSKSPFTNSTCKSVNQSPLLKLAMPGIDINELLAATNETMEIYGNVIPGLELT
jgi:hypothetical protein